MEISLRVIRGQLFGKVGMDVYLYPSTPNCMSIRMPTKILTTRKLITELKKKRRVCRWTAPSMGLRIIVVSVLLVEELLLSWLVLLKRILIVGLLRLLVFSVN